MLILIGPNQGGKSTGLMNLQELLQRGASKRTVVAAVEVQKEGTGDDLLDWFRQHYHVKIVDSHEQFLLQQGITSSQAIRGWWDSDAWAALAPNFIHRLDTGNRLQLVNPKASISIFRNPPREYIHQLQMNSALHTAVSKEVKDSFGQDLVIDWAGGPQVGFRIGLEPSAALPFSKEYVEQLDELPTLESQGDGVRSFVGTLLAANCGGHPVLLIDEPEAFLHPPQARRLGAAVARTVPTMDRQVIVATHSAEFVQGALAASGAHVSVCRLTRDGTVNHAALLDSEHLAELWSKPLLRSSATIDGLFHKGVVVCEAHSDSQFYDAVLQRMVTDGRLGGSPDLYFVQGGGKGELPTLARAYASLRTKAAVIADLDLLRDINEFKKLLSALGVSFSEIEGLYTPVAAALGGLPPEVAPATFAGELKRMSENVSAAKAVTSEDRRQLQSLLQGSADWSAAKRYGLDKLKGEPRVLADQLLEKLAAHGLFLVPEGQLEGWWRYGPADKTAWVIAAVNKIAGDPDPFEAVTGFMESICGWFKPTNQ